MSSERRTFVIAGVVVAVILLALFVFPWAREELAPELVRALVAIELEGEGVAVVGPRQAPAGTGCTLHAVLEARTLDGSSLFYTEAPALEIDGQAVAADRLRRWDRTPQPVVLWFTVEGLRPFAELGGGAGVDELRFTESLRPDWPRTWSIPCDVLPSAETFARGLTKNTAERFGTQRYHVRIELYSREQSLTPQVRFASPGAAALPAAVESFPTLTLHLPGLLDGPSSVFGLSQLEPAAAASDGLRAELAAWSRQRLAFSRASVLSDLLTAAGKAWQELAWRTVDLVAGPEWGSQGAAPGDLLRVGERVVVLYADRGEVGRLDRDDLCFDYIKGAGVRTLGEVFVGGGLVEWARMR